MLAECLLVCHGVLVVPSVLVRRAVTRYTQLLYTVSQSQALGTACLEHIHFVVLECYRRFIKCVETWELHVGWKQYSRPLCGVVQAIVRVRH